MTPFIPLRTFLETCRSGSVSRAAAALGITQPAASAHIRTLEDQLGRPLFERHARGVRVTAAGEELATAIGPSYDTLEATFAMLRVRAEAIEGTIRIAGPSEFMNARMVEPIATLAALGLTAHVTLGGRDVIYGALETGEVDLAITASRPVSPEIGCRVIQEERLLPVAAPAWAARLLGPGGRADRSLTAALAHPPLAYDEQPSQIARLIEREGRDPGSLRPSVVVPDLRFLRALVEGGSGWTVLPDYLIAESLRRRRLVILSCKAAPLINRLYLAWPKSALRQPRVFYARQKLQEMLAAESLL
ncbi:LysR family transcriptional regulator [Algihabitans albus]|uniref:LysR family transcriptional regulator n=1 Tax=Algihabitans albus TaxID=2164067 RepID=UPI000E5DA242|nr:LysR family transcriptional regulator [Algihabitans albus]